MRALLLLLLLAACVAEPMTTNPVMTWPDLLERPRPAPDRTIAYGADPLQVVDLWLPKGVGPHPVVLMLHGGCWKTEIADRTIMNWIADDLRTRGIAVWNVDYRGVDRGGGYPGTYQDVVAAANLLESSGEQYRLRTDRRVAIGHSAGGHLALWLASAEAGTDVAISSGGLPDLEFSSNTVGHGCGTDGARAMAGTPPRYSETSPIAMTPRPARQIQVNTSLDRIAPPSYAEAYRKVLAGKGVAVETVTVAGEGHVELIAPESKAWAATVKLIEDALRP